MSVPERLHHFAATASSRIAAVNDGTAVSYGALGQLVERLAAAMFAAGIRPGEVVGLTVRDEFRHLVTALALMRLGCPSIILATHEPLTVRAELASRSGTAWVLTDNEVGRAWQGRVWAPDYDRIFADARLDGVQQPMPGDDDVAILATSSGTTGRPKIMPVTHGKLLNQALGTGFPAASLIFYFPLSVEFCAAQRHRLYTVGLGGTNVFFDRSKESMIDACRRHGVTLISMTTGQARGLADEVGGGPRGRRLPEARVRIFGAMVGPALVRSIAETVSADVEVIYGATECGCITSKRDHGDAAEARSVGRPPAGVTVEIVDENDRRVGAGEVGAIRVRNAGMIDGYLDDPDLTRRAFRDGWFYPGDVGRLTEAGTLALEGRGDEMMNLSGIKISPAEIEAVAETFPGVAECAAFAIKSEVHGDIPALAVAADGGVDLDALRKFCRARLGVRAPRKIVRVDHLPRNAAGKVSSLELRAMVNSHA